VTSNFEAVVTANLAIKVGAGSGSMDRKEQAARLTLQKAMNRLKQNPELRRQASDGQTTYSDPVLAVAALWGSLGEGIDTAGVEGSELKNASLWRWAIAGVQLWLNRDNKGFLELASRVPTKSIKLKSNPHIAIVGDAGYRGVVQDCVVRMIQEVHAKEPFDVIVHLGDIYFSGGEKEVIRNFLVPFSTIDAPLLSLCGNHDLYHGPDGYLALLKILRQPGRYFLVETPAWKIAALDTSSGSANFLRNDGRLDPVQLEWLQDLSISQEKPLILLSHHFIVSGWDKPASTLSRQLTKFARKNVFAWYWGHEHRCAYYGEGDWGFHGASVGNGAFLEELAPASRPDMCADWESSVTGRCSCPGIKPDTYWPHGFLELDLFQNQISETYHLENGSIKTRTLQRK
jgi:hypothetical protein